MTLTNHPAIAAFEDAVYAAGYELRKETEADEDSATVHPMNPPYQTLEYVTPFVEDLCQALEAAGLTRQPGRPGDYRFAGQGLTASVDNVSLDEDSDPIQVTFNQA